MGKAPAGPPVADTDAHHAVTGEPRDDSGLTYLRARYYNPGIGRFLSADPFPGFAGSPQSLNRYAYAGNNPVNRQDPSGMCGRAGANTLRNEGRGQPADHRPNGETAGSADCRRSRSGLASAARWGFPPSRQPQCRPRPST